MNQSAHSESAWRTSWPNTKEFSPVLAKGHTNVTTPTTFACNAQPVMPWGNVIRAGRGYQMIVRSLIAAKIGRKEDRPEAHYLSHILLY